MYYLLSAGALSFVKEVWCRSPIYFRVTVVTRQQQDLTFVIYPLDFCLRDFQAPHYLLRSGLFIHRLYLDWTILLIVFPERCFKSTFGDYLIVSFVLREVTSCWMLISPLLRVNHLYLRENVFDFGLIYAGLILWLQHHTSCSSNF